MATKAKAQVKEEAPEKEAEGAPDSPLPLLDLNDAGVKKMIKAAKKRGFVTFDALNAVLPSEIDLAGTDRRHHGDAQRDGHQRRRDGRRRRRGGRNRKGRRRARRRR